MDETTESARSTLDRLHERMGALDEDAVRALVPRTSDEHELRVAAAEALVRRQGFAERDGLVVRGKPLDGPLGLYAVARDDGRSYDVLVRSVDPIDVSCGCADFVRSGLGLCKHAMEVLASLRRKGRRPRATTTQWDRDARRLAWDPLAPLGASTDRLLRLRVEGGPALDTQGLDDPERRRALLTRLTKRIERGDLVAEPAARTVIREELERVERARTASRARAQLDTSLRQLARALYPYQREGVERFLATGRLLLADDMGLGKTTQAIACCHAMLASRTVARARCSWCPRRSSRSGRASGPRRRRCRSA